MASKFDKERLATKQAAVAERIKEIAAFRPELLISSLPEHTVDLLVLAFGLGRVWLGSEDDER